MNFGAILISILTKLCRINNIPEKSPELFEFMKKKAVAE